MTDFWSTNLHIPVGHDRAWVYRFDYDQTIRENAFGRFEDLLIACSLHPAMRFYLDNWKSVKNKPNENQGRELLELHTVGRDAGYTEAMVKSSAVLLSGYTVNWGTTFAASYDATKHTTGPVQVLDFTHPNASADGQAATLAYLSYLAHHPATARNLARKLATYFVSDSPSDGLVDTLAQAYLAADTDIKAVLRVLSAHPEFLTSQGQKVRTPIADLVATARVLDVDVQAPSGDDSYTPARQLDPRQRAAVLVAATRRSSGHRPDVVLGLAGLRLLRHAPEPRRRLVAQGRDVPRARLLAAGFVDPVRRLRRPPVQDLARTRCGRTPAEGRDAGGDRTREVGHRHRLDRHHPAAQPRQLAVPAARDGAAGHPRPHDDLSPPRGPVRLP